MLKALQFIGELAVSVAIIGTAWIAYMALIHVMPPEGQALMAILGPFAVIAAFIGFAR